MNLYKNLCYKLTTNFSCDTCVSIYCSRFTKGFSSQYSISIPPENVRKPLEVFREYSNGPLTWNRLNVWGKRTCSKLAKNSQSNFPTHSNPSSKSIINRLEHYSWVLLYCFCFWLSILIVATYSIGPFQLFKIFLPKRHQLYRASYNTVMPNTSRFNAFQIVIDNCRIDCFPIN